MSKPAKILIHYTHKGTLGHTTRIQSLCYELVRHYGARVKIHVLQGGLPQPFIQFPRQVRLIPIPAPFDSRASFHIGHKIQKNDRLRSNFVMQVAQRIDPDVFLTEFFPFGRQDYIPELLPALQALHHQGTRIHASIGYPCCVDLIDGQNKDLASTRAGIIALYDKLLIHTPEGLENSYFQKTLSTPTLQKNYARFYRAIASKTVHTGYIVPSRPGRTLQRAALTRKISGGYSVIVSRGGGAVYPRVILNAIKAQKILGRKYRFILALGPSTTPAERSVFNMAVKKNLARSITLLDDIPDLPYFLGRCDASVSLCGYNTSVQLLRSGIPGIVVPFVNPNSPFPSNEQSARALLLHDHAGSSILPYEHMTPEAMAETIREKCEQGGNASETPASWFNGAVNSARLLMQDARR